MAGERPLPSPSSIPLPGLLRESPLLVAGALLVAFWVVLALLAPALPLLDPNRPIEPLLPPLSVGSDGETVFWLGTDPKGRDILSRLIWGARRVLLWASLATLSAYAAGIVMGLVAGYRGGLWDDVLSFLANLLLSFPVMVLYIVIITRIGASPLNIVLAVTFASAPGIMRIVRGLVLDLRNRDYIAAAQIRGERELYILFVELLPNARGPLLVDACLRMGYTTITLATLGFLGLGLPPPDPDWGAMIAETQPMGAFAGHAMILPALAVSSLVLGFNMLADGLRERSLRE